IIFFHSREIFKSCTGFLKSFSSIKTFICDRSNYSEGAGLWVPIYSGLWVSINSGFLGLERGSLDTIYNLEHLLSVIAKVYSCEAYIRSFSHVVLLRNQSIIIGVFKNSSRICQKELHDRNVQKYHAIPVGNGKTQMDLVWLQMATIFSVLLLALTIFVGSTHHITITFCLGNQCVCCIGLSKILK
ncbi:hypothetical protein MKX01_035733, partial [Papaver californicum]